MAKIRLLYETVPTHGTNITITNITQCNNQVKLILYFLNHTSNLYMHMKASVPIKGTKSLINNKHT
uniref:Uncharacterized protein n=1 Tax=Lotus japonicus TaxID=34305 RepID=I3SKE7_LOTJA|nr:unknown [Lotus japonicus]